jgi:hypothetical protein
MKKYIYVLLAVMVAIPMGFAGGPSQNSTSDDENNPPTRNNPPVRTFSGVQRLLESGRIGAQQRHGLHYGDWARNIANPNRDRDPSYDTSNEQSENGSLRSTRGTSFYIKDTENN